MLAALRERDFRLLWLGQMTSMLGNALVPVALAFAVLDLTGSATDLGLVLAAQTLPLVLFLLAGGVWADRLPRQLVMVASDVVRGCVHVTIALLLVTGAAEVWHLAALMAVFGTAEAFFQPAYTGVVPHTVPPERLQQANALLSVSNGAMLMAGPAIAGVLVAVSGPWLAFAFDAVTFAVSGTCLLALSLPRAIDRAARTSFVRELREGWDELVSRTWLWTLIAWAGTYLCFVVAPFYVLGPVVAKEELGGATAWAAISSAWAAGSLVGGAVALRWRPLRPMLVCCWLVFWEVVPLSLLALAAPVWLIAPAQAVGGAVMGLFMALWATTLQQHVPAERLSRVSSYDWLGSLGLMPLGYVLAGPVAGAIGVSTTLWISVAWVVVSTSAILLVRDVRTLRRSDLPATEPLPATVEAA